jgi:SanA protein
MGRRSMKILAGAATLVAGAVAAALVLVVVSNWWVHRCGGRNIYDALSEVPARDVAIVPGVGGKNGVINDHLRSRLLAALSLYRAHKVNDILVSGVGGVPGSGDEISSSRSWLAAHGVGPAHILTDPAGFRTLDTMQRAARVYQITSAAICSQSSHLDRSLFLARATGINAVGFTAVMRQPLGDEETRLETLKSTLAFVEAYVFHRGPRVTEPVGLVAAAP